MSVAINFASGPPPIGWLAGLGSGSLGEFLAAADPDRPGCLAFDVRLPGQSGLDFHDGLSEANVHLLVIFISAHPDVPISVLAMKAGAAEFLTKPVRHQELLETFRRTVERGRTRRADERLFSPSGRF